MSKILEYGTSRIIAEIPPQLLAKTFNAHPQYGQGLFKSREEIILDEVVRKRVLVDCNIVGGEQRSISLNGVIPVRRGNANVYRIPLSKTGGRHIISVMSLETIESSTNNSEPNMIQSILGPETLGTSKVELVGPNCIATEVNMPGIDLFLRCMVGNDPELSNFSQKSYLAFGTLCVMAAKATIYNRLIITVGESGTNGGNTNAATQSMIDNYSDATELYNEYLRTKWQKISKFADSVTNKRMLEMISF